MNETQSDKPKPDPELASRLLECRLGKGFTVERLAEATGLSATEIQQMEEGIYFNDHVALPCLAQHFGVNVLWLLTGLGDRHLPKIEPRKVINGSALY